ncbi:MAG TPA: tetratricopeptide repeat protein [Anaerolineae bacterium]|nr:tetratricopeptide repeat protein [Anaerolineae bacterium]
MPGLPSDLHRRVCAALMASGYCDSADALRAVCVDERLAPWRDRLPDARDPQSRAEAVIDTLWDQHANTGENVLALLLHTLSERFDPGDARHATLADLADACETAVPWTGGTVASLAYARLHTLPAPPRDFVGREDELETLLQAVETGGATISGLRGMGGVGKTTLALKLAEQLTPRYPDAQFYLDLRGVDPQPLTPTAVMTAVLRAYYPTARLPEDEAQLQPLYRSVLQGQRALLLLDNAADAAQLRPLLPPASCLLLVTSRQRFTLPGLHPLDLDAMPKLEAEALLREIAPRVDGRAGDLADLCGCLPLALRWAGDALNDTTMSVPRFLERLQHERRLLEPADAALRLSYNLLPPDLQALWRQLSIFPGDFDWLAAAAVWAIEREPAEDALDVLTRRSLLACHNERYVLHDLARLWANTQATADERAVAAYRHAEYYEQVLRAADDLYLQGNEGILAGLTLYDREVHNIHAGFAWASSPPPTSPPPGGTEGGRVALCSDYPDAGVYILDLRLHPRERIRWLEAALRAAREIGDRRGEGSDLNNLGLAYADLGDLHRAIEYHEQALVIAREIGDRRGEGADLGNLGLAYADLGDLHRAIEFYEQRLVIAREIGDRRGEGNALGNLGNAYADLGDLHRAIEFYEQRLAIAREIGDRRGEGNALGNLGNAYADLGDLHRAIEYYEQASVIDREIGDRRGEGANLGNLGLAYADLGDLHRAIEYHEQHLVIAREIGDRRGEGAGLANMGLAHKLLGEPERARVLWQAALAIYEAIEDPHADRVRQWLADLDAPVAQG